MTKFFFFFAVVFFAAFFTLFWNFRRWQLSTAKKLLYIALCTAVSSAATIGVLTAIIMFD